MYVNECQVAWPYLATRILVAAARGGAGFIEPLRSYRSLTTAVLSLFREVLVRPASLRISLSGLQPFDSTVLKERSHSSELLKYHRYILHRSAATRMRCSNSPAIPVASLRMNYDVEGPRRH